MGGVCCNIGAIQDWQAAFWDLYKVLHNESPDELWGRLLRILMIIEGIEQVMEGKLRRIHRHRENMVIENQV